MRSNVSAYQVLTDEPAGVHSSSAAEEAVADQSASDPSASRFISLTARLFLGSNPLKVVALVSCQPREGVTHVGRALRNFLALRMSFSATLLTGEECLQAYRSEKQHSPVAARVTDQADPAGFLQAAGLQNRVVLIDCPPLCSSATVLSLATYVDGVLLVVEDGKRSKAEIERAVSTINAAQGQVLGIILNKRRYILPNWLYGLLNH